MSHTAQIITSYGRRYIVRTPDGQTFDATTRKKRVDFACGDQVEISPINAEQVVIEDFLPRQSLLYRQDAWKTKLIAANVSQLLIVTAAVPSPSEALLQRALLAAEAAEIEAVIVLNKADLPETAQWRDKLAFYETLGYRVLETRALEGAETLKPILQGHTNIFLGQSGMGKSTLTNALLGNQAARTGDISTALDSGKHTTTHAQLYDLNEETQLIDSPGLQEFGLHHLEATDLLHYFPDLRHLAGQCRFHNCTHRAEPSCAVKAAAEAGEVKVERVEFLQRVTDELLR
ncbi:ribosome small subunit-dependent GTPase A [Neisseria sp. N95_16]|uniref:Small ribosomal subunit biogenesis GTPase RsgA n=1 Tax=Neisseria brasiliensis TaxID=2666100 RepID=A0A5Q3S1U4_9NEIS|nr:MULTISPECIES: ribosome small subunit-dependent GTPase A [Neisseria]MRN38023.1 ribosome small subunit-dependent GTPase A [Neisseria brasiliensis]PJO09087.1 ribosome small subunit-dependent GTPase A [Neisseria sp. N95_16]PJO77206.1 ribosome small subunit-dependent GTPase A [Neisseria sp. N177_16]QGL24964.1 ribosome small subunit-dependent GTPase A [Neisseria brasiliensis]